MKPKILEVGDLRWRTSRRSAGNGACVEIASAAGTVLVRDSQDQTGPIVQYPGSSWRTFLGAVKVGHFDLERL